MRSAVVALACLACSPAGPAPAQPASVAHGPDAERAVGIAKRCVTDERFPIGADGYVLLKDEAVAHREGDDWLVEVPTGMYLGRLAPPAPPKNVWVRVDLARGTCELR